MKPATLPVVLDSSGPYHPDPDRVRRNTYSLLPGQSGQVVTVRHTRAATTLDVTERHGELLAHDVSRPTAPGAEVRLDERVTALTKVVLADFSDRDSCPANAPALSGTDTEAVST